MNCYRHYGYGRLDDCFRGSGSKNFELGFTSLGALKLPDLERVQALRYTHYLGITYLQKPCRDC